jgi:hypothetical protein
MLKKCSINDSYRKSEGLSSIKQRFLIEISGSREAVENVPARSFVPHGAHHIHSDHRRN